MSNPSDRAARQRLRILSRWFAAVFFVLAGANHFAHPALYVRIVPPSFPDPALLVAVSGVCEIAGGMGLLVRRLRVAAGWGLVALLIAVFPANLHMARHPAASGISIPEWMLLLRLPLQGVLIVWVWFVSRDA